MESLGTQGGAVVFATPKVKISSSAHPTPELQVFRLETLNPQPSGFYKVFIGFLSGFIGFLYGFIRFYRVFVVPIIQEYTLSPIRVPIANSGI